MTSTTKYLINNTNVFHFINDTKERIRTCYSDNSVGIDKKRGNLRK